MFIQVSLLVLQVVEVLVLVLVFGLLVQILSMMVQADNRVSMEGEMESEKSPWVEEAPQQNKSSELGDLDRILDFALRYIAYNLSSTCTQQPVPDIDMRFPLSCGIFQMQGHLSAKKGSVEGFETLHRDGAATSEDGDVDGALHLDATAALRHVRLRYHHYEVRVGGVCVCAGTLQVELSPVSLRARLALTPPFAAQLHSLHVARAGPIRVGASGLGVLGPLLPLVQRWLDRYLQATMHRAVDVHLARVVQDTLERFTGRGAVFPPMRLFPNCKLPELPAIKSSTISKDKEKQRKKDSSLNAFIERSSLSAFMVSPYLGRQIEHQSTAPFR